MVVHFRVAGIQGYFVRDDLDVLIDERVLARMEKRRWPGLMLGIQLQEDVRIRCYGFADLENGVTVQEDSVFAIGSLTKQFTAALILRLAELDKLSLDDEITRHLPNYPVGNRHVTIHHLLTHTSGIQSYSALPEFRKRFAEDLSPEEIADVFKDEPFQSEPGERFDYNNSGYHLLGMIIEAVVGKPYSESIEQCLFHPLGLQHTRYFANAPIIANRVSGYVIENRVVRNSPYLSWHIPYAAGAIGSTAGDLLKWQHSLSGHEFISESSLCLMRTSGIVASGEPTGYGYGVHMATFEGEQKYTHNGGIPGFTAVLSYYPAHDLAISVLVNMGLANVWAIDSEIARILLDLPTSDRPAVHLSRQELERYAGLYLVGSQEAEMPIVGNGLAWMAERFRPIGDDVFLAIDDPECTLSFTASSTGIVKAVRSRDGIDTTIPRAIR